MSTHALDNQIDERLVNKVAELERQYRELRTAQAQGGDVLGISRSPRKTTSLTLAANAGGYVGFAVWFVSPAGIPVFGTPEYSLYEDDATISNPAKVIGSVLNNYRDHYTLESWPSEVLSTDDYIAYLIYIFNHDSVGHTVYLSARVRWLVTAATLSTT